MTKNDLKLASQTLRRKWEKYRGHHVLVVRDQVFAAKTGEKAEKLYRQLQKQHPKVAPLITYIPKKGSLILWS
jgi:hypothetical protein